MVCKHEYMNIAPAPAINDAGYATGAIDYFELLSVVCNDKYYRYYCFDF